jgi:hypothetical protein
VLDLTSSAALLEAQQSCENSGHYPGDLFIQAVKMVALGSDSKRDIEDIQYV